jgi:hypothetical protein
LVVEVLQQEQVPEAIMVVHLLLDLSHLLVVVEVVVKLLQLMILVILVDLVEEEVAIIQEMVVPEILHQCLRHKEILVQMVLMVLAHTLQVVVEEVLVHLDRQQQILQELQPMVQVMVEMDLLLQ